MVRNREKHQFLEQWGAQVFVGDLREPESFEPMLLDIEGVVLLASALADRNTKDKTNTIDNVDDVGMRRFIDAVKAAGELPVVYASMLRCDELTDIKMMRIKHGIEAYLAASGLPWTVIRLAGFMQGLIPEYALPILEKKPIRVPAAPSPIAYISTLDAAKYFLAALTTPATRGQVIGVSGPEVWSPQQVISLCDELAGVKQMPKVSVLSEGQKRINEFLARLLDAKLIDLLRFSDAFGRGLAFEADMAAAQEALGVPAADLTRVEPFLREYFRVLKQSLKRKNYQEPKVRSPF
jgi:uncharacterized protein YbjT (DUF2867 family)